MAGIYLHIPFCAQFCKYCDFYSVKLLGLREAFVEALLKEMTVRKEFFKSTGSSVTTVYMGGGTPSVLSVGQLGRIVKGLRESFGLDSVEEFTIEVNPNDVTPEYAAALVGLGINRVSMGVQSFVDSHLVWMNRRHSALEGERAVGILRDAGIANISIDLIFGFEMLGDDEWEYNIKKAISLRPQHISAYQMSIEPGSALGALARRGKYHAPSEERCEAQYRTLQHLLSDAGYNQYEISNFALSEDGNRYYRSLHNSSYWERVPYLGLGPSAHSYTGELPGKDGIVARREWNTPSIKKYCRLYSKDSQNDVESNNLADEIRGYEELTARDIFNETIMLGLRKCSGFAIDQLDPLLYDEIAKDMAHLVSVGQLRKDGNRIWIPSDKLFISDAIIRELFL